MPRESDRSYLSGIGLLESYNTSQHPLDWYRCLLQIFIQPCTKIGDPVLIYIGFYQEEVVRLESHSKISDVIDNS